MPQFVRPTERVAMNYLYKSCTTLEYQCSISSNQFAKLEFKCYLGLAETKAVTPWRRILYRC